MLAISRTCVPSKPRLRKSVSVVSRIRRRVSCFFCSRSDIARDLYHQKFLSVKLRPAGQPRALGPSARARGAAAQRWHDPATAEAAPDRERRHGCQALEVEQHALEREAREA